MRASAASVERWRLCGDAVLCSDVLLSPVVNFPTSGLSMAACGTPAIGVMVSSPSPAIVVPHFVAAALTHPPSPIRQFSTSGLSMAACGTPVGLLWFDSTAAFWVSCVL